MGCRRCAAAGPGARPRPACAAGRCLESAPCPVTRSGRRSSTRRRRPTPSAASCSRSWRGRSRSPRARAGATRSPTSPSPRRSRRRKSYSMPKDNIQRAIDRGTGAGSGDEQIERVVYEGYGPGGAAILVDALTDNRNRTGSEVRHAFDKARRQPRRARLGRLAVREEGRGPGRRRALRRGGPAAGDRRRRRGRRARRRRAQGDRPSRRPQRRFARRSSRPGSRSSPPS